jgi:SAM-dependent methyltransferase
MDSHDHAHDHDHDHAEVTRRSFERQRGLFVGPDAPFARRASATTRWLEPLDPEMVVLDVACGAAHVAEQVAPYVRQVVGVDMTRALLDTGAARLRDAGVGNVLLQEGDAAALPFVDASFDLVVCRTALHHFPDVTRALDEMRRVCRPGARVVVADMVAPSDAVRGPFDELHRLMDPSHVHALLDTELAELMDAHVGPVTRADRPEPLRMPIDAILTDAGDRGAVLRAVDDELDGGPATGFEPVRDDDRVVVSFHLYVVEACVGGSARTS